MSEERQNPEGTWVANNKLRLIIFLCIFEKTKICSTDVFTKKNMVCNYIKCFLVTAHASEIKHQKRNWVKCKTTFRGQIQESMYLKLQLQSITYCFTVRDAWKKPNEAFNIECIKQSYMCVRNCISNDIDK